MAGVVCVRGCLAFDVYPKLLIEVARRLSGSVRTTDTVARVGGDEFVILLPDIRDGSEAVRVAAKLVAALEQPLTIEEKPVRITASIGVVTFPDDCDNQEALIQLADEAMYRAKECGKNRIEVNGQPRAALPAAMVPIRTV